MSIGVVKKSPVTFGAAGTQTAIAVGSSTSNQIAGPREDFSLQLSVTTTGTSIATASVVLKASNDATQWFGISSATIATTSTLTSSAAVGIAITGVKYAHLRVDPAILVGTGSASVTMGM